MLSTICSSSYANNDINAYDMLNYISYDLLPPINSSHITTFTIQELTNPIEVAENFTWEEQFVVITKLRIIHKYLQDLFYKIFNFMYKKVKIILNDSVPKLSKNILLLLTEIFNIYHDESTIEYTYLMRYLKCFLPVILKKTITNSNNSIIKLQFDNCLANIKNNMLYFDTLLIIVDIIISNNKNLVLGEKCFNLFSSVLSNIPKCYFEELSNRSLCQLIELITDLHNLKTTFHTKMSYKILEYFIHNNIDLVYYIDDKELVSNVQNIIKNKTEAIETKKKIQKERNESKEMIQKDKLHYILNSKYNYSI